MATANPKGIGHLKIYGLSAKLREELKCIAKSKGISRNTYIKQLFRENVNSYPDYIRNFKEDEE
jgi:hypothetical protein